MHREWIRGLKFPLFAKPGRSQLRDKGALLLTSNFKVIHNFLTYLVGPSWEKNLATLLFPNHIQQICPNPEILPPKNFQTLPQRGSITSKVYNPWYTWVWCTNSIRSNVNNYEMPNLLLSWYFYALHAMNGDKPLSECHSQESLSSMDEKCNTVQ